MAGICPANLMQATRTAIALTASCLLALAIWRFFVASVLPFSIDEAYYVAWSKTPDWGYWTKPPFIAWAIGAARWVCGESTGCVRSVALLSFPLTSAIVGLLTWRMSTNVWAAASAAILFATLPLGMFYGIAATTDALLLLCWAAAMWSLLEALHGKPWAWIALGVCIGLGMLAKYSMAVIGLSIVLTLLHSDWRAQFKKPWPYLSALVALLVFAPNIAWNLANQMPTFSHTADISRGGNSYGLNWQSLFEFEAAQVIVGGPLLVIAFAMWLTRKEWRANANAWLLLCFALPMLFLISAQALLARAHANWASPTYVALTVASVVFLWSRKGFFGRPALVITLVINLVLSTALYYFETLVVRPLGITPSAQTDPYWTLRNWPDALVAVKNTLTDTLPQDQWRIASDDRGMLSMAQAVLHLPAGAALGWQRRNSPQNHFEQRFPLSKTPQQRVLLITQASQAEVLTDYPHAQFARRIDAQRLPDGALRFTAWWINP
jgi:4-amino-4-deoxy-L-arabinose transferase-like glycosyltransferase